VVGMARDCTSGVVAGQGVKHKAASNSQAWCSYTQWEMVLAEGAIECPWQTWLHWLSWD
jgi:hypothetical protein